MGSRRAPSNAVLVVLALMEGLGFARTARAGDPPREELEHDAPAKHEEGGVDVGVLGGIGFPRPLAIEAVVGLDKRVMFGAEYGFMPTTAIGAVDARMWSGAANVRWFPFRGAFFVGLRGGYQEISCSTTLGVANVGSYSESVDFGTWFVNPRVGFLWNWKPFALGIDAGVQIPISSTVSRSALLALAAPELDGQITSTADTLGRTVLPTVDLLKIGLVF